MPRPPLKRRRGEENSKDGSNTATAGATVIGPNASMQQFRSAAGAVFGPKSDFPTPESEAELERRLMEHEKAISAAAEPRSSFAKDLARGTWNDKSADSEKGSHIIRSCVEVVVPRGKLQQRFGSTSSIDDRQALLLRPEEALFLSENGTIEVTLDGIPISVEEMYVGAMERGLSLEEFIVFTYFCRFGYTLTRFSADSPSASFPANLDQDSISLAPANYRGWYERCKFPSSAQLDRYAPDVVHLSPLRADFARVRCENLRDIADSRLPDADGPQISFNVFKPGQLRRHQAPAFRICVCALSDEFPSLESLARMVSQSGSVSLRMVIVSQGTLNFFSLSE